MAILLHATAVRIQPVGSRPLIAVDEDRQSDPPATSDRLGKRAVNPSKPAIGVMGTLAAKNAPQVTAVLFPRTPHTAVLSDAGSASFNLSVVKSRSERVDRRSQNFDAPILQQLHATAFRSAAFTAHEPWEFRGGINESCQYLSLAATTLSNRRRFSRVACVTDDLGAVCLLDTAWGQTSDTVGASDPLIR